MQKVDVHPQDKQETQRKEDECRHKKDAGVWMDVGGRSGSEEGWVDNPKWGLVM